MDIWVYDVVEEETLQTPFGAAADVPPEAAAAADAGQAS